MRLFRRTDGRYYAIMNPTTDLFGDYVIVTYHGNEKSRAGGEKTFWAPEEGGGIEKLYSAIVKTRIRHGYHEVAVD